MSSIVLELQNAAMDSRVEVDDLLRKCVVIASKLQIAEFLSWAKKELNGYQSGDTLPDYRTIRGEIKAHNPYNGLMVPFIWETEPLKEFTRRGIGQRIAELRDLVSKDKKGTLIMTLPEEVAYRLMQSADTPTPPVFVVSQTSILGVLDAVRNVILEWSLKLEADGILGEGMTFTPQEKKSATNNIYKIKNFSGVLGDVSTQQIQIGDYNSIQGDLKALGIPQQERDKLKDLMDAMPKAKGAEKKNLIAQGIGWVVKHGDKLGALSDSIRGWFHNAA